LRATERAADARSCAENPSGAWEAVLQAAAPHAAGTSHGPQARLVHAFGDSITGCTCTNAEQKTVNKIHVMCFMAECTIALGCRSANVIP